MGKTLRELESSIGDWLNVNDNPGDPGGDRLPQTVRKDMVNMAIRELLRKHDTKFGQFSVTFQTVRQSLAYDAHTIIEGFSRPYLLWYLDPTDNTKQIEVVFKTKQEFDALYPIAGIFGYPVPMGAGTYGEAQLGDPCHYTYWADKFELGRVPNRAITMFLTGYRLLPDLDEDEDGGTNLVTSQAWEYVLFKALSLASEFGIEDDRIPGWEARAGSLASDLAFEHHRARASAKRSSQSQEPG